MRDDSKQINGSPTGQPAASPPEGSTGLWRSAAARVSATGASLHGAISERIFIWSLALYTTVMLTISSAEPALAQGEGGGGGGGGAIEGAIQSAVDWLSNLITILGTLGLMVAAVFWLFSGSDERKRQRATSWLVTCALAIGVAFLAPEFVSLISDWTGGGQGGGGI